VPTAWSGHFYSPSFLSSSNIDDTEESQECKPMIFKHSWTEEKKGTSGCGTRALPEWRTPVLYCTCLCLSQQWLDLPLLCLIQALRHLQGNHNRIGNNCIGCSVSSLCLLVPNKATWTIPITLICTFCRL
jgi:hypothetical protein